MKLEMVFVGGTPVCCVLAMVSLQLEMCDICKLPVSSSKLCFLFSLACKM